MHRSLLVLLVLATLAPSAAADNGWIWLPPDADPAVSKFEKARDEVYDRQPDTRGLFEDPVSWTLERAPNCIEYTVPPEVETCANGVKDWKDDVVTACVIHRDIPRCIEIVQRVPLDDRGRLNLQ